MTIRYTGLIAPEETPTGDGRLFKAAGGTSRLPATVMVKFESGGHKEASVVGKMTAWFDGPGGKWGTIEFLDPAMVPEVAKTCYMLDQKVLGPSVDLDQDYTVKVIPHPKRVDKKAAYFESYNVVGVTLVPMPAFAEVHLSADTEEEVALLASVGVNVEVTQFDINLKAWDTWPIAPREYKYDADDAVKRIAAWSGIGTKTPSLDHYASAFLWRNGSQTGDTLAQDSFRLPLCDIINGNPHLVFHAVYAAAALLSGGHGGLPNIPQPDQERMKAVITQIYAKMRQQFGDQGMKSPFEPGGGRQDSQASMQVDEDCGCDGAENPYPDNAKSLLAGIAPVAPPRSVFDPMAVTGKVPFTVTDDGRVFGHLAEWRKCHVGIGNACVMAPRSRTDYAYFAQGDVKCEDGSIVKAGVLSFGSAHADERWGVQPARAFYDDSSKVGAVVTLREDRYGIFMSGVLTPNVGEVELAEIRRSRPSGDWRVVEGNLELVAALMVNSPGFPVVNYRNGQVFAMTGVGVLEDDEVEIEVPRQVEMTIDVTAFAERVAEVHAKEEERRTKKKAGRIAEIDAKQQELAASATSTIIARQYDAKFEVVAEKQDAE